MRTGRSGRIGMVQWDGIIQFAAQRARHVAQAIQRSGYQLLASDACWFMDDGKSACEAMIDAHVEGVVLLSPGRDFVELRQAGIPMVCISGFKLEGVPQVRPDVKQGMADLTSHLLALGYRRMALLTQWPLGDLEDTQCWYVKERVAGYREACWQVGLTEKEAETVFEDFVGAATNPYETGKVAMTKLLRRGNPPEAVLCSNDDWALGALAACAEANVRVPEEIVVTGFDSNLVSEYGAVPLTTVAQPLDEMANRAVETLLKMIRGEKLAASEQLVKVPCQVQVRRSCGAALAVGHKEGL